ncbi:hypothetical protein HDU93_003502, partial [Gonapodya sp. JEL0774]
PSRSSQSWKDNSSSGAAANTCWHKRPPRPVYPHPPRPRSLHSPTHPRPTLWTSATKPLNPRRARWSTQRLTLTTFQRGYGNRFRPFQNGRTFTKCWRRRRNFRERLRRSRRGCGCSRREQRRSPRQSRGR